MSTSNTIKRIEPWRLYVSGFEDADALRLLAKQTGKRSLIELSDLEDVEWEHHPHRYTFERSATWLKTKFEELPAQPTAGELGKKERYLAELATNKRFRREAGAGNFNDGLLGGLQLLVSPITIAIGLIKGVVVLPGE